MTKQKTTFNQNTINNTYIEEDNNTPEIIKEIVVDKRVSNKVNPNKVKEILQRSPTHYGLLMEDGRRVVVFKSLFDRNNMVLLSNE